MKVLVTDKSAEEALKVFQDAGHELTYDEMDHDTLLKEIPKYDALMVRSRTKATTEIVEAGAKGNLKVIGRAGIGVDNIDIETAGKLGIKVVNSPTGSTKSVAELAVAHMLSLARFVPKADSTMKKGEWIKKQLKGIELNGKTLGLVGSGYIAQHVASIANCLGMKVLVYSPHCTDEKASKMRAIRKDLEDLLKQSDFVSLHIPHTKDSHYLLNEKTISLMKPGSYLVNVARGGVVEEKALYLALKEEKLAGAAVDVFEQEPPSEDNKLLSLDNVILSPHIGASTKEAQIQAGTVCAEQMNKVLNGEEPEFWVNKKFM
ncbi:MAG: hydroxyacid dehydrogenase [Thermoplasmatales archaeon]|nr:hydroxyacid dehydrogenase [Thermoplasmatales archaeon]